MAQPYVGEIRMFAGNFAPAGWMFCEGQLLPISENETLFQLIGTTYGGDGESTFALPDLRGRLPIHQGNGFILAETGGAEEITLTVQPDPGAHPPAAGLSTGVANQSSPASNVLGAVDRRRPLHRGHRDRRDLDADGDRADRAAASRTRTSSRTCASTSSSRCSASSRTRPEEPTMADPFVAEIRIFPFNFAPKGWAWCNGQLLPLSRTPRSSRSSGRPTAATASPPSRCPTCRGARRCIPARARACSLHDLGETGGIETVTLLESEIPSHTHTLRANADFADARRSRSASRSLGPVAGRERLQDAGGQPGGRPGAQALAPAGGDQPHNNLHAVPDLLLQHRPPGRLPAAPLRSRCGRSRTPADERRIPARASTRARAPRSSRPCRGPRSEKARLRRAAVRGPDRALRAALRRHDRRRDRGRRRPGRAGSTSRAGRRRSGSSTSRCCPEHRGAGVGTRLLSDADGRGRARPGKALSIHVERDNPALRPLRAPRLPARRRARRLPAHGWGPRAFRRRSLRSGRRTRRDQPAR